MTTRTKLAPIPDPGPSTGNSDWADQGLCKGTTPDMFFPETVSGVVEAQLVCHRCPVKTDCLRYALDNHIEHGVWGGVSERQRRILRKNRRSTAA